LSANIELPRIVCQDSTSLFNPVRPFTKPIGLLQHPSVTQPVARRCDVHCLFAAPLPLQVQASALVLHDAAMCTA
jgi:hypothetical protein